MSAQLWISQVKKGGVAYRSVGQRNVRVSVIKPSKMHVQTSTLV